MHHVGLRSANRRCCIETGLQVRATCFGGHMDVFADGKPIGNQDLAYDSYTVIAITSVSKHSKARKSSCTISYVTSSTRVTVSDNKKRRFSLQLQNIELSLHLYWALDFVNFAGYEFTGAKLQCTVCDKRCDLDRCRWSDGVGQLVALYVARAGCRLVHCSLRWQQLAFFCRSQRWGIANRLKVWYYNTKPCYNP